MTEKNDQEVPVEEMTEEIWVPFGVSEDGKDHYEVSSEFNFKVNGEIKWTDDAELLGMVRERYNELFPSLHCKSTALN